MPAALLVLLALIAALAPADAGAEPGAGTAPFSASSSAAAAARSAAGARAARGGAASGAGHRRARRALLQALVDHDLSFESGSQASSAIALEVDNPARAIAASNDAGGPPLAFISDQGLASGSVFRHALPSRVRLPSSDGAGTAQLTLCCDPTVAADLDGNLWMAAASAAPSARIVVGRVATGATAFGAESAALPRSGAAVEAARPALAVRSADRIAAAWVESTGAADAVVVSQCSLAAGATACDAPDGWSAPQAIAAGGPLSMPALSFGPGGDLFAVWWDQGASNAIRAARCPAGDECSTAAGWEGTATIANLDAADDDGDGSLDPLPERCPIIAAPGGLVNPSPSIDVDAAGTVYVAYSDLRDNADPNRPTRCTASGTDKTFDSLIAAGPGPGQLPAADSGRRLSADGALELNDHFLPALSVDPSSGAVEASFYSTEGDPGGQRAVRDYVASADFGASYSAPVVISDGSSRFSGPLSDGIDYGERQGADSAGGVFRPVWTDNRALQSRDPDLYTLSPEVETTIVAAPAGEVPDAAATIEFTTAAIRAECRLDGPAGRLLQLPAAGRAAAKRPARLRGPGDRRRR